MNPPETVRALSDQPLPPLGAWECSNDAYHAETRVLGNSMKETFLDSPALFHGRFITETIPRKEADELELGKLAHLAVLEPARFAAEVYLPPPTAAGDVRWDLRGADHKKQWADVLSAAAGRLVPKPDHVAAVDGMVRALRTHSLVRRLLDEDDGPTEHTITWHDPLTQLHLKSRRDKVCCNGSVILDLKTARDPAPRGFRRAAADLGYHRQADWYLSGHRAALGLDAIFVFAVVRSSPPFEVAVHQVGGPELQLGHDENEAALLGLARAYDLDDWTAPWQRDVNPLVLPRWAFRATDMET